MSIPHARRPPIPMIFKSNFTTADKRKSVPKNIEDHNNLQTPVATVISPVNASQAPQSVHRHFILPAPHEKNVKYVPFTPGPRSIHSQTLPVNGKDGPKFQSPVSPDRAQASETADESTLAPSSSMFDTESRGRNRVLIEKTNFVGRDLENAVKDQVSFSSPSLPPFADEKADNGSCVLTAISDSSFGMMNLNANTAHLETAASLRSIRSTLDQLRKKRSVSRSRTSELSHSSIGDISKIVTSFNQITDIEPQEPELKATQTETISTLVSQLFDIIRPRRCPDHKGFMVKWSSLEYKAYTSRWMKLMKSVATPSRRSPLSFPDIPWPVFPAIVAITPHPFLITTENLTRFLICPHDNQESSLKKIVEELDRWNNFQVMDTVLDNVCKKDRKQIEEAWSRVVIVLMEIRANYSAE